MSGKRLMTALRAARREYVGLIQTPAFLSSFGVGLALMAGSLGLNYAASIYANAHQSNFVRDVLLDCLPLVDTSVIVDQGMVVFAVAVTALAARFPARVPFLVKSVALVFWDRRSIRLAFLAASVVASAAVLLAHVHYTIDVLGALFITPTIYRLAEWGFSRDLAFGPTNGFPRPAHDRGLSPVGPLGEKEIPGEPAGPWSGDPGWTEPAGNAAGNGRGANSRGEW